MRNLRELEVVLHLDFRFFECIGQCARSGCFGFRKTDGECTGSYRQSPALVPLQDPNQTTLIRTRPINRTRNYDAACDRVKEFYREQHGLYFSLEARVTADFERRKTNLGFQHQS